MESQRLPEDTVSSQGHPLSASYCSQGTKVETRKQYVLFLQSRRLKLPSYYDFSVQSIPRLMSQKTENDPSARWWLLEAGGDLKTALTISVHKAKKETTVEMWELTLWGT